MSIWIKQMEITNCNLVSGIRTFNNEKIVGELIGFNYPTEKMRANNELVAIIYVKGAGAYDVYPNSLHYLYNSITQFNKYRWIS